MGFRIGPTRDGEQAQNWALVWSYNKRMFLEEKGNIVALE